MASPDPRITPFRTDVAADRLRGIVAANRYVSGVSMLAMKGVTPIRAAGMQEAEQVNELRYGDGFTVYEQKNGWAWGQSGRDHYVGYVPLAVLQEMTITPTHRVKSPSSFIFPSPSIKAPPMDCLTFFSAVEVIKDDGKFAELKTGGFVHAHHVRPISEWRERDIIFTAGRLLQVPYLWGGVTPLGLDCSGLVQLALNAAGISCPRDSDMQAATLGQKIAENERDIKFQRGDIVFFPGHVGFMADAATLLHANAYHGCVVAEPLTDALARGGKITAVRRLD